MKYIEILLLPYKLYRYSIIKIGLFCWHQLGIKPSSFVFCCIIISSCNLLYQLMIEDPYWYKYFIILLIDITMFIIKMCEETSNKYSELIIYQLDLYGVRPRLLVSTIIVLFMITSTYMFVWYWFLGFYWLEISGEGGKFWKSFRIKARNMMPVGV